MRDELIRGDTNGWSAPGSMRLRAKWLAVGAVVLSSVHCGPIESAAPDIAIELRWEPSPPVVGNVDVSMRLTDAKGTPLAGAEVRIEGNMNHAGMKPIFADLAEVEPGRYSGTVPFTMGGDWFLLVTATTPEGNTVDGKIDVLGVRSR